MDKQYSMSQKPLTAYTDCFSGISGDMFLGALVDCGLPEAVL
ncbi:MAG: nickel insertion protein, partial [Desulfopila sp.]|nr:nickel insertion protein [Desulfopila sp.]